jgi:hypothetical protein
MMLNNAVKSLYFLKSRGFIIKIMKANSATKLDRKRFVTFVAKGEMAKNSKNGKILNIRKAYITRVFSIPGDLM